MRCEVVLNSDHESLKFLSSQHKKFASQVRLSNELEPYAFVLKHKPRKENTVADALICLPQPPDCPLSWFFDNLLMILAPLRELYVADSDFFEVIIACQQSQDVMGMFTFQEGFLFRGLQLCTPPLLAQLIHEIHLGVLGGHFGVLKIL